MGAQVWLANCPLVIIHLSNFSLGSWFCLGINCQSTYFYLACYLWTLSNEPNDWNSTKITMKQQTYKKTIVKFYMDTEFESLELMLSVETSFLGLGPRPFLLKVFIAFFVCLFPMMLSLKEENNNRTKIFASKERK